MTPTQQAARIIALEREIDRLRRIHRAMEAAHEELQTAFRQIAHERIAPAIDPDPCPWLTKKLRPETARENVH